MTGEGVIDLDIKGFFDNLDHRTHHASSGTSLQGTLVIVVGQTLASGSG